MVKKKINEEIHRIKYSMTHWKRFHYHLLTFVDIKNKKGNGNRSTYNDCIIMLDTETSKSAANEYDIKGKVIPVYNYVVAWSLSIRADHHNIVTLWGNNPQEIVDCVDKIREALRGYETYLYIHNMSYDWVFLQKFFIAAWGHPAKQLNTKPHYPISIRFDNGLIFKDSLILSQRSLQKWADDMNVDHKKAVGYWDYNKIRNQSDTLTDDELKYIECDTLAGVECIDSTMQALRKNISSIPMTATGIPREGVYKASDGKGKRIFSKMALTFDQQTKMEKVYHGGYTHANRHWIDTDLTVDTIKEYFPECEPIVKTADFSSSYPYCALAYKFPMEKFMKSCNLSINDILSTCDKYAYTFKLIAVGVKLKNDFLAMPPLQFSKCTETVNAICDNGRILCADYVEIYLCDPDLEVINKYYDFQKVLCVEVEFAEKDYLPRYLTDYIYDQYKQKTTLKGGDPVQYAIAKAKVNSIYGMMVQKPVKPDIVEIYETGEYIELPDDLEEKYQKYLDSRTKILCYQWGVYITAYAFRNLHLLTECFDYPLYCDTDSCYGVGMHKDKLAAYNENCKQLLLANGYGAVEHNGREYWLGIAEHDPVDDIMTEFKMMGAKRYCYRKKSTGKLSITVAGVPKKKGAECLDNDIKHFTDNFIFDGDITGKLTHYYISEDDIKTDIHGNIYGDSVDLVSCDYRLGKVPYIDWESLLTKEITIQIYEEE